MNVRGALADIGWDGSQREKLWRYNQHYFDDLNALRAGERDAWHQALLSQWLVENPPVAGTGWEPYPTSLRIVNWVKWALAGNTLPTDCVHSLAAQARWLRKRLEWHLLGNHLFANAKALVFAGVFFEGEEAQRWLQLGCRILQQQLPEQVLADGAHFERSTMYHALALEDVLDLVNLCRAYDARGELAPLQEALEARVEPMLQWLLAMCHQDGEISFFNDAALGIAPSVAELLAYAARLGFDAVPEASGTTAAAPVAAQQLQASGYLRFATAEACALLDVAPIGPDYLPGHAHADTLSFELSVFGQRVFVNSGTSVYGLGAERLRQRGTAAHNTVVVAGRDSSEVWSGFRVARRAYPEGLAIEVGENVTRVRCAHDGYRKILAPPVTHEREWQMMAGQLAVTDVLTPPAGATGHEAQARYHLHPSVRVLAGDSPELATLLLAGGQQLQLQASAPLQQKPASYHPRFGVSEPTTCLVLPLLHGSARLSIAWGST